MIAPEMPSRTRVTTTQIIVIVPVQKAFSLFTRRSNNRPIHGLRLSGLRRGEIAGAKWSDIDFDAGTISIARSRVQVGAATVVENEPKTQSSRRTLPLDEGLIGVLKRASSRYAQEKLALGAAHADSGYV